jgi:hypothetical protein
VESRIGDSSLMTLWRSIAEVIPEPESYLIQIVLAFTNSWIPSRDSSRP